MGELGYHGQEGYRTRHYDANRGVPLPTHQRPCGDLFGGQQDHPEYDPAHPAGYETASTGLMMVGAREYDPEIGRFLQPDPQPTGPELQWGQLNRWVYCANDPVNASDPSGEHPLLVAIAVLLIVALIAGLLNWQVGCRGGFWGGFLGGFGGGIIGIIFGPIVGSMASALLIGYLNGDRGAKLAFGAAAGALGGGMGRGLGNLVTDVGIEYALPAATTVFGSFASVVMNLIMDFW